MRTRNINLMNDAAHWRDRAEECRTIAESMKDAVTKRIWMDLSKGHLKQAQSAENWCRLDAILFGKLGDSGQT